MRQFRANIASAVQHTYPNDQIRRFLVIAHIKPVIFFVIVHEPVDATINRLKHFFYLSAKIFRRRYRSIQEERRIYDRRAIMVFFVFFLPYSYSKNGRKTANMLNMVQKCMECSPRPLIALVIGNPVPFDSDDDRC